MTCNQGMRQPMLKAQKLKLKRGLGSQRNQASPGVYLLCIGLLNESQSNNARDDKARHLCSTVAQRGAEMVGVEIVAFFSS